MEIISIFCIGHRRQFREAEVVYYLLEQIIGKGTITASYETVFMGREM